MIISDGKKIKVQNYGLYPITANKVVLVKGKTIIIAEPTDPDITHFPLAITLESFEVGSWGEVLLSGSLFNVNTNAYSSFTNTILYLTTNGVITATPGNVSIGSISKLSDTAGEIFINFSVDPTVTWGDITGTLADQTDLQEALDAKTNLEDINPLCKLTETVTKGQAVYISSANGTNMLLSLASNDAEVSSSKTFGLAAASGVTNDFVRVITSGFLAGLDTSGANAAGDPVWLGVDGQLLYGIANKPYAPAHLVFIGIVTRKNNSNGEIYIRVQNGFELDELHNVSITTPKTGNMLVYDEATSLWKNSNIIEKTSTDAALRVTQLGTGDAILVEDTTNPDSTPFVVAADGRVGIGVQAPLSTYKLHVRNGAATSSAAASGTVAVFENNANAYCAILSPDANVAGFALGSNTTRTGALVNWGYSANRLAITTAVSGAYMWFGTGDQSEKMRITGDGNVGIGTTSPNASALLDISSTTKGILIPRMTTTERNAISSPATGLMVYDSTLNAFYFYNGSAWDTMGGSGGSSFSSGITVTPPTGSGTDKVGIVVSGTNTNGGSNYVDFLKATNTTSGATNINKFFRLNVTGQLEIVNSAYSAIIMTLTDSGLLNGASATEMSYLSGVTSNIQTQLNAKQNSSVYAKSSTTYSSSGTGTQIIHSLLIPANTFVAGDVVRFTARFKKTGSTGTTQTAMYLNTSVSTSGATVVKANVYNTGTLASTIQGSAVIINSTSNTQLPWTATNLGTSEFVNSTAAWQESVAINWTTNQYLLFVCNPNGAGDVVSVIHYLIEKL